MESNLVRYNLLSPGEFEMSYVQQPREQKLIYVL